MSKDIWIAEYEAIPDIFGMNVEKHGEEFARLEAERELRRLGFGPDEVKEQISLLVGCL